MEIINSECPNCGYKATNPNDLFFTAYNGKGECPECKIIVSKYSGEKQEASRKRTSAKISTVSTVEDRPKPNVILRIVGMVVAFLY